MLEQALDLAEEQEYDEAILIYNKILKINPNNMNAIIDKATTLQRLGKNSLALTLYERALKNEPKILMHCLIASLSLYG